MRYYTRTHKDIGFFFQNLFNVCIIVVIVIIIIIIIIIIINNTQSVLLLVHGLFQSKFSTEFDLVLPL